MANDFYTPVDPAVPGNTIRSQQYNNNNAGLQGGFDKLPNPDELQVLAHVYAVETGTVSNAYEITLDLKAQVPDYIEGMDVAFLTDRSNTGPSTLSVNGLAPKPLVTLDNFQLTSSSLVSDVLISARYDGTSFRITSLVFRDIKLDVNETQTLTAQQTTVVFDVVSTSGTSYYVEGQLVDRGRLLLTSDYTVTNSSTIELTRDYPAGTQILAAQNEANTADNFQANIYESVFNREVIDLIDGISLKQYTDDGRDLEPRLLYNFFQYTSVDVMPIPAGVAWVVTGAPTDNLDGTIDVPTSAGVKVFSRVHAEAVARRDIGKISRYSFKQVSDIDTDVNVIVREGDYVSVEDYTTGNNSGILFFRVVAAATGTADGGKYIDLLTLGLQLEQNMKLVPSLKDWGVSGNALDGDATQGVLNAISYADLVSGSLYGPSGVYPMTLPLAFTKSIDFKCAGSSETEGTLFTFSGASMTGRGVVELQATATVGGLLGAKIGGFKCSGTPAMDGWKVISSLANPVVDSSFEDITIFNCAIGLDSEYAWDNVYKNMRFQTCTQSFSIGNQTNATHFDRCSFVSASIPSEFSNAEGIVMTAPDISNQSGSEAFRLFQSYVQMNTPYFENNPDQLCSVGSGAEVQGSALRINGGLIDGDVSINNNLAVVEVNGSRLSATGSRVTTPELPRYNPNRVQFNVTGAASLDAGTNTMPITESFYGRPVTPDLWLGAVLAFSHQREYYTINNTGAAGSGIYITQNTLTIGEQYTLFMAVRCDTTVVMRDGTFILSVEDIPTTSEEWRYLQCPWVASGDDLIIYWVGDLQVKGLCIYKGVVETGTIHPPTPAIWYSDSIPSNGTWRLGDEINRITPSIGATLGWICTASGTPGTWVAKPNL